MPQLKWERTPVTVVSHAGWKRGWKVLPHQSAGLAHCDLLFDVGGGKGDQVGAVAWFV